MRDVFVSYAAEDREAVQRIVEMLTHETEWSVWWRDADESTLDRTRHDDALGAAKCVVVVWSHASADKQEVRAQADEGRSRGVLLPVLLEDVRPPYGFRFLQPVDLKGWNGREDAPAFRSLLERMCALIQATEPSPQPGYPYLARQSPPSLEKTLEELTYLAHHDALTELANRSLFLEHLDRACHRCRRAGNKLALMLLDLDGFKAVNDWLGHDAGDHVLRTVASKLMTCVRKTDLVARLGGDEFTVVLEDIAHIEDAARIAQKMVTDIARPIDLAGNRVHVTASVGVATCPIDSDSPTRLLKTADIALYHAKEQGANNFQFFTPAISTKVTRRLTWEHDLSHALERNQFLLLYQPQIELASGRVTGVEALLRWRHPKYGEVLPEKFVPFLEDKRLIDAVGQWSLRTACAQSQQWHSLGLQHLSVAVNLSPTELRHGSIVHGVKSALDECGLEPRFLELEVSMKSTLAARGFESRDVLAALRSAGVRITLDGVGDSPLGYLSRLPFDALKLEKAYVSKLGTESADATVARAVIEVAQKLGIDCVADGVDNDAILVQLHQWGCVRAQGQLFSQPLPPHELEQWLHGNTDLH